MIALQDFLGLGEISPYTFVIFTKAKQLASKETDQQTTITNMLYDSNIPDSLSNSWKNKQSSFAVGVGWLHGKWLFNC